MFWQKYLKPTITSAIFFYFVCFLAVWCFLDLNQFKGNAISQAMSRFVPGIHYFGDFVDKKGGFDQFKLHQCIAYHKRVTSYFPYQKSEAYQMMGFCSDRLGNKAQAIKSYESATQANPQYIWPPYNLGIYAYKKGDYTRAIDYFEQALSKDVRLNILMFARSKVFNDVRSSDRPNYDIPGSVVEVRKLSYIFLMESLSRKDNYNQLLGIATMGLKENLGDDDIFLYYAGRSAFYQKDYARASELLQMSIQKNPQNPEALFFLAQCMRLVGKEDMAQNLSAMSQQVHQQVGSKIEKYLNSGIRFF